MEPIFDASWHAGAVRGEAEAVGQLARKAVEPLYRFCLYRVGRKVHLCEEVVQETLLAAVRRLEHYDPRRAAGDIFPWLTGLARNEIRRALAREKSSSSLEAMWAAMDEELRKVFARLESDPFADETLLREETREMVGATMSQLPARYRLALEAKYVAGKSVREIAAALAMTEKAVESQLSRARRAFRETFLALAGNLTLDTKT